MQQATRTPGKVPAVIEKDFGRVIGTLGERIIRVVLDQSGRVVEASVRFHGEPWNGVPSTWARR